MVSGTPQFIFLTTEYSLFISRNQNFSNYPYTIMDQCKDCLGHQLFRVHGAKDERQILKQADNQDHQPIDVSLINNTPFSYKEQKMRPFGMNQ